LFESSRLLFCQFSYHRATPRECRSSLPLHLVASLRPNESITHNCLEKSGTEAPDCAALPGVGSRTDNPPLEGIRWYTAALMSWLSAWRQGFGGSYSFVIPSHFLSFSHSGAKTGARRALSRPRSAAPAGGAKRRALTKPEHSIHWCREKGNSVRPIVGEYGRLWIVYLS
jgi:hypothetical protein